ncbi:hypothetical protein Tco_0277913 [Tanacetum coccineum]
MKAGKKGRKQTHADTDAEHDFEEDERKTESMNKEDAVESTEKGTDASKKRKGGLRMKRQSKRKKTDSDLEEEEHLKTFLKIIPDEEGIIDFEVLEKRFPIINWESKFYHFDRHGTECIYYRIFRSDGSSRWNKTFSEMVTRFDRLDLVELYNLKMNSGKIKKGGILTAGISMKIMVSYFDTGRCRLMKLESMMEERRIFKCWFHHHTTNGHQFTMYNRHQELASPEQTALALAIPEQTATSKEISNPFMAKAKEFQDYKVTKELKFIKEKIKSSSVFGYILQVFKKLKLKKHEVSLDLSRLATTLNRLERSYQTGIYNQYCVILELFIAARGRIASVAMICQTCQHKASRSMKSEE